MRGSGERSSSSEEVLRELLFQAEKDITELKQDFARQIEQLNKEKEKQIARAEEKVGAAGSATHALAPFVPGGAFVLGDMARDLHCT